MNLLENTKTIQTRDTRRNNEYLLFNAKLDSTLIISSRARNDIFNQFWLKRKLSKTEKNFLEELVSRGFLVDSETKDTNYIYGKCEYDLPLSSISFELTDSCNLKCVHCYGSFSHPQKPHFIPFKWIQDSFGEMEKLHTKSISLTGGECTIHPQFIDILLFFLRKGFEVTVFTNGSNVKIIKEMLEITTDYEFSIKLSLDGFKNSHNIIRGVSNSYDNAIESLNNIIKYDNISLFISTTVMKTNLLDIDLFKEFIRVNYPKAIHTHDLVFPFGDATNCSFSIDEFEKIKRIVPSIFSTRGNTTKKGNRCSGGISQCAIMADGRMKICNAASHEAFYFSHNVYNRGIINTWMDCGENVSYFRKEKTRKTDDCNKCKSKKICNLTDCRVQAKAYFHSERRSNPLTCFIINEDR